MVMPVLHRIPNTRIRLFVLLAFSTALALPRADVRAQEDSNPFLPSTLVPNYDRVRIGHVEGLEGGAFIARTGDAGANWYNPAGLALAEYTSVNTTSAFEWTTIELGGLSQNFGSDRVRSLGGYYAGVLGRDVLGTDRLRLGFAVTRPVQWSPGSVNGAVTQQSGSQTQRVDFYSSAEMSTLLPSINAGLRLSAGVRVGGGIAMGITNMKTNRQVADRLLVSDIVRSASQSLNFDGQYWQMQLTAGVQWDVNDRIRLGATLTTPGLGLGGSALLIAQSAVAGPEGREDVVFRDANAPFEYRLPSRAVGGMAMNLGAFEVEADVRYYGGHDRYEVLSSEASSLRVTTDGSGELSIEESVLPPVTEVTEPVTNLALGINYPLAASWRLHAGAFTDGSPVGDPETSPFGTVDLTGISFAVSFGGRLSGSVGVSSSWGTTTEATVGPDLGGRARTSTVGIRTVNLHYAFSYTFN
jgi:hypothetical protein